MTGLGLGIVNLLTMVWGLIKQSNKELQEEKNVQSVTQVCQVPH